MSMRLGMTMTTAFDATATPRDRLFAWLAQDDRRAAHTGLLNDGHGAGGVIGCRIDFIRDGLRDTVCAVAANPDPTRIPPPGKVYLGPDATLEECVTAALRAFVEAR